jgi:hypothetical protein
VADEKDGVLNLVFSKDLDIPDDGVIHLTEASGINGVAA